MEFLIENSILKGISGKEEVTEIRIPEGITSIDREVFYHCTKLKNVVFPESLESIDFGAFMECTSLKEVELPQNLKRIGCRAFRNCYSLEKIILPEGLESIGADAFGNCTRLKEIRLPQTLHSLGCIEDFGIYGWKSGLVSFESRFLGSSIFAGCDSLADADGFIIIDGVLYDYLGEIREYLILPNRTRIIAAYFGIHLVDYKENQGYRYRYALQTGITNIIIPEGVVSIRKNAFTEAKLGKIIVPASIRSIEKGAFSYTYSDLAPDSYESFCTYYDAGVKEIHYCGDEYQWADINQKDSVERDFYKETGHYPYNPIDIFFTATIGRYYYTDETGCRIRTPYWVASNKGKVFESNELKRYYKRFEYYDKVILIDIEILYSDLFDGWTSLQYVFYDDSIEDFGNLWDYNDFDIKDVEDLKKCNEELIKPYNYSIIPYKL